MWAGEGERHQPREAEGAEASLRAFVGVEGGLQRRRAEEAEGPAQRAWQRRTAWGQRLGKAEAAQLALR